MIERGGGPEVFYIGNCVKPEPCPGDVLIMVKAFGINRSEAVMRQLFRPKVPCVRVLGIEAVGIVEAAPGGEFIMGSIVATVLGSLASQTMGSYAEYVCVPASQVLPLKTSLSWAALAAIPHIFQAAYGSLKALNARRGQTLLIRGGTTAVGLAATAIASMSGVMVTGTTRNENHKQKILSFGAVAALLDRGSIAGLLLQKFDKVLELVGTTTLTDSIHCVKKGGKICVAGMVGGGYAYRQFNPMGHIPNAVQLTSYCGDCTDFMATPLQDIVNRVETTELLLPMAKVFRFEEIVEAHRYLEQGRVMGKIVITL